MLTTSCSDVSLQRFCWQQRVAALHICTKRCLLAINPTLSPGPCVPLVPSIFQMGMRASWRGRGRGELARQALPSQPWSPQIGLCLQLMRRVKQTARGLLMVWDDHQKAQTIKSLELRLHACRLKLLQLSPSFNSPFFPFR